MIVIIMVPKSVIGHEGCPESVVNRSAKVLADAQNMMTRKALRCWKANLILNLFELDLESVFSPKNVRYFT